MAKSPAAHRPPAQTSYSLHSLGVCLWCMVFLVQCGQKSTQVVEIRGIYGHPKPFWEKGIDLRELGVNAIFVHSGSIDDDMMDRARAGGLLVFAEFATLNGKHYVDKHPEAWPINEYGERAAPASWFMGVCPNDPGFREYRYDQLRNLLSDYDLDGVWLDYVHWHAQFEEPEPILPETCFCGQCLLDFSEYAGVSIQGETTPERARWILDQHNKLWRDWRCSVILDWTYQMKNIVEELRPSALLGLYHCPWNDEAFDGARRRILGLDYDLLRETIDVFSPMVYHGRMGRDPLWVEENIVWFCGRIGAVHGEYPKVWPIVQAYDDPEAVTPEEFKLVLRGGLAGESSGVMMFTSRAVAGDEGKMAVMKEVYTELALP